MAAETNSVWPSSLLDSKLGDTLANVAQQPIALKRLEQIATDVRPYRRMLRSTALIPDRPPRDESKHGG